MVHCTLHYISTRAVERIVLDTIRRVSRYATANETDFIQRVRDTSVLRQEKAYKENRRRLAKLKRRNGELDGLVRKLYEGNATGKVPDRHFERMLAEYDAEQAQTEAQMRELQSAVDGYNADSTRTDKFIELAKRYTQYDRLTVQMLNEFIEKIVVHEADRSSGRRTQRTDVYLNFIGNFTVPDDYDGYTPEQRAAIEEKRERLDKKNAYENARRRRKRAENKAAKAG